MCQFLQARSLVVEGIKGKEIEGDWWKRIGKW
jgi:hypothetical protein